ncbi:MAG: beta-phosphoglucomutase [Chitinivibrionales bacterium]|nr:beta-phosphoglucomutase [Chitinivibrionales bacterium]MBD3356211.1 beta-phosphoglucomutase [Chitinivibrionales bacterium]
MAVKTKPREDGWDLSYTEYIAKEEKLRETLTTVGNGYFGTRGCPVWERSSEDHYPGTYIAGVYNKLPSTVHGKEIFNDDFVNCPNWLLIEMETGAGKALRPLELEILEYEHNLNMHNAVMFRSLTVKDRDGRVTRIETERFAGMANPHHAAIRFKISPVNYSDQIALRSSIDGTVYNDGVARYRNLASRHLNPVGSGAIDKGIYVQVETNQSHTNIVMCARNDFHDGALPVSAERSIEEAEGLVSETLSFKASEGRTYILDKIVSIATSRDENTASAFDTARTQLARATSYNSMLKAHQQKWHELWDMADIRIEGDPFSQKVIRLHAYHLLVTASPHSIHIDAGMPARGLHGEAYRGHIFWDSIYVLPVFYQRFPQIARAALMYRYRRLDAARNNARENGFRGAMYPWQSSHDGSEETQVIHYNPVSGKWDPDLSCRQRHVSIAIFYNVWEYYCYTADTDFLHNYGAEMLVEIARFWASIAQLDENDGRYHIKGVMGPDEFHEKYPEAPLEEGGLNDNAYTNIMVAWVMEKAIEMVDILPEEAIVTLTDRIAYNPSEKDRWLQIGNNIHVPMMENGIIEQFEGYRELLDVDWDHYKNKYGNIHRMDRILKSEGDSPDKYKVSKQADALMAFFVIGLDETVRILKQLGHSVGNPREFLRKNYNFYIHRTSHGSTLSKVAHSVVSRHMSSPEEIWRWFLESLESDIYDTQGGTTIEGIHCAVMGGTINIVSRVFAGITYHEQGKIDINPALPKHWKRLAFKLQLKGVVYSFEITRTNITVEADPDGKNPLVVRVKRDASS